MPLVRGVVLFALMAAFRDAVPAEDAARSRLVVIGDVSSVLIGQDGYCGDMDRVLQDDLQQVSVPAGRKTWIRYVAGGSFSGTCSLDFSFTPQAGQAYIARYALTKGACQVELFRVRPGLAPTREPLTPESRRSCLLRERAP